MRGGAATAGPDGLPLGDLVAHLGQGCAVEEFSTYGTKGMSGVEALEAVGARVLVEMTPTNLRDGQPGLSHVRAAIARGMDVVSANKGPFVLFYDELHTAARGHGCRLHLSAATAAALPTLDVGTVCLAGARLLSAEGILNGTTNYILTRMHEEGCSFEEALGEARRKGIAETDPTLDVSGRDTANKMIIICNRLFGKTYGPGDISVEGITGITPDRIERAAGAGRVVKLIGSAHRHDGEVLLKVSPEELDGSHPLASVNGTEKAISYLTDSMDRITVMGGKSSPVGAAAAVLKDLINACAGE